MFYPDLGINADLNGALPFSADSEWNTRVDGAPLLWNSAQVISAINPAAGLHPDFGSGTWGGIPIGIPYVVVPADQPLVPFINTLYASESDPGPFPIPDLAPVQGDGTTDYNDRHLIVVQQDPNSPTGFGKLYEFFQIAKNAEGVWQGYASVFDLNGGDQQRPMGWTSATAAGLPIFPGLLKYDEVQQAIAEGGANGVVHHALAFTLNAWNIGSEIFGAAEHMTYGAGAAGFGMHFRLSPDYKVDPSLSLENQVILNTLKTYGMILTDNGGNYFLSGVPDERWDNSDLHLLQWKVHGSDFQVADTTSLHAPKDVTIGSGADALVLKLSEDAYKGNAQFTVSIDGKQVGGVQTLTAYDSLGLTQTFSFKGDWGPDQHKVSVNFVNGLSDADGTRGLHVKSMAYDGVDYAGGKADMKATGTNLIRVGNVPTFGSGPDRLELHIAEDAWQGDAKFTVSVDGRQAGGVLTATTLRASNQTQDFAFLGSWGGGLHTVVVNYINEASDPASGGDRNLYVWGMSYNGTEYAGNTANMYTASARSFQFGTAGPIGSGADRLVLHMAEDAWAGVDAQFTVSVDGVQVGGTQSASQYRTSGKTQDFTLLGNWGAGQHQVVVNFLNAYNEAAGGRHLFAWGMSYDGVAYNSNMANLYYTGATSFLVGAPTAIGSGKDSLVLKLSEDAYQGNAQFTVSVDGVQVGGLLTAGMFASTGKTQDFTLLGNWGAGQHQVVVNFLNGLNEAGGGRHLFLRGMSYDGLAYDSNISNMYYTGKTSFLVGTASAIGSGKDSLVLRIAEDAYLGNAQFTVSVDGVQVGGLLTAGMFASMGKTQDFTLLGDWGSGQHTVTVNFVNGLIDAGGSRNLFIRGMSYDGVAYGSNLANLYGKGSATFKVGTALG